MSDFEIRICISILKWLTEHELFKREFDFLDSAGDAISKLEKLLEK